MQQVLHVKHSRTLQAEHEIDRDLLCMQMKPLTVQNSIAALYYTPDPLMHRQYEYRATLECVCLRLGRYEFFASSVVLLLVSK